MSDIAELLAVFVHTGVLPTLAVGLVASLTVTAVAVRRRWLEAPTWLVFGAGPLSGGRSRLHLFREGGSAARGGDRLVTRPDWPVWS